MPPSSLAVTPTAPGAVAPDAPAAPALTLAADTRSVRLGAARDWRVLLSTEDRHYFRIKGQEAEAVVHQLADGTFLADWCYPNPMRSDGKELCDLLVVFDDLAFIWQIKDLKLDENGKYKPSEVEKNLKQLAGARRVLFDLQAPIELTNPRRGTELFDPGSISRVYLFSVLMGEGEESFPFAQEFKERTVHVLTRDFAPIVLHELDTVSDFTHYCDAKEKLFESGLDVTILGREEELLAYYILNDRSFGGFDGSDHIMIEGGGWESVQRLPAYVEKQRADGMSYGWDSIIDGAHMGSPEYELIAREMARTNRLERRILGKDFFNCHAAAHEGHPGKSYRHVIDLNDVTYCFLFMDDPEPLELRRKELMFLCYIAGVGQTTRRSLG
jgi:hypothetical protein